MTLRHRPVFRGQGIGGAEASVGERSCPVHHRAGTFWHLLYITQFGDEFSQGHLSAPLRGLGPEELRALQSGPSGNPWNEDSGFKELSYLSKNVWNEEISVPGNVAARVPHLFLSLLVVPLSLSGVQTSSS